MIEILAISCIMLSILAGYFFAESRSLKRWITKQDESAEWFRTELRQWQNKALQRNGSSTLGSENRIQKKETAGNIEITPRVVHRSQLDARLAKDEEKEGTVRPMPTTHSNKISYESLRGETLKKAEEIIDATK